MKFAYETPNDALAAWLAKLSPISGRPDERVAWSASVGRVLGGEGIVTDRPSPPCDTSAMDGYAVRKSDIVAGRVQVVGESYIGAEPDDYPTHPEGQPIAVKAMTGAPVPKGADCVIKREDVEEGDGWIDITAECVAKYQGGEAIRREGENAPAGVTVVPNGTIITQSVISSMAGFGCAEVLVRPRVRVGVITTGDELLPIDGRPPEKWEIRDSNGPTLDAILARCRWVESTRVEHVCDDAEALLATIQSCLETCDAIVLTGGVSMGDRDFVPEMVGKAGGEIVFHRLPLRPGKPILAAVGPNGQAIIGLPGNPVSVMVGARRMMMPALMKRAGITRVPAGSSHGMIQLESRDAKRLGLWWYRPVLVDDLGRATLLENMGSGDFAGVACSDGFVEIPPDVVGCGPFRYWPWSVG